MLPDSDLIEILQPLGMRISTRGVCTVPGAIATRLVSDPDGPMPRITCIATEDANWIAAQSAPREATRVAKLEVMFVLEVSSVTVENGFVPLMNYLPLPLIS